MTGFDMRDGSSVSRQAGAALARARDVADFQSRWAEFRPFAQGALRKPGMTTEEADTMAWMIEVMDRIRPRDLDDIEEQSADR